MVENHYILLLLTVILSFNIIPSNKIVCGTLFCLRYFNQFNADIWPMKFYSLTPKLPIKLEIDIMLVELNI